MSRERMAKSSKILLRKEGKNIDVSNLIIKHLLPIIRQTNTQIRYDFPPVSYTHLTLPTNREV